MGPGLTTGAADDDPSGIATYSQAGARFGYAYLWLSLVTFPLMAVIQEMCARIGMVTGRGLASNIRLNFSKSALYFVTLLLFVANVFNIGADLGALAEVTKLLIPISSTFVLITIFGLGIVLAQIFIPYRQYAKFLKWLTSALLAYILTAFFIKFDFIEVVSGTVLPTINFDKDSLLLIVGVLGTTISPYLFFWQTSQEVEEEVAQGRVSLRSRQGMSTKEYGDMNRDIWSGMFYSNLIMYFIIAVCAATLNKTGITDITSAAQAAQALRPLAGDFAFILFAIGIIGTGLLAIPVLAGSAAYALSETFNWREGLNLKFKQAHGFYAMIIFAVAMGWLLNFINLDPIKALIYSAAANGLIAPVIMIYILKLSNNQKIMGEWVNCHKVNILGYLATGLMFAAGLAFIISLFF